MSVNEVYFRDMTPSKKVFFIKKKPINHSRTMSESETKEKWVIVVFIVSIYKYNVVSLWGQGGYNNNCTQEGAFLSFILSPGFMLWFGPIELSMI